MSPKSERASPLPSVHQPELSRVAIHRTLFLRRLWSSCNLSQFLSRLHRDRGIVAVGFSLNHAAYRASDKEGVGFEPTTVIGGILVISYFTVTV